MLPISIKAMKSILEVEIASSNNIKEREREWMESKVGIVLKAISAFCMLITSTWKVETNHSRGSKPQSLHVNPSGPLYTLYLFLLLLGIVNVSGFVH